MIREIQLLENSDLRPVIQDLPIPRWVGWQGPLLRGDVYGPALGIFDAAEAEQYLIELVSWRFRWEIKRGLLRTYAQLVRGEREEIGWFAFGVDVTLGLPNPITDEIPRYSSPNRIGEYPALDRVGRLFGAFLPEQVGVRTKPLDLDAREIIEDAEITGRLVTVEQAKAQGRRRRAAKKAGIVTPPNQAFLFE